MLKNVLTAVWCRFGSWSFVIKLNFCSDFKHKVWSRFWSWSSGEILKLNFCQYFDADFLLKLWSWIMVKIWKPALVNFLNFKFSRDGWDFEVGAWSRFWKWKLIKICVRTTQPSGPLCLWQCFFDELQPERKCYVSRRWFFLFPRLQHRWALQWWVHLYNHHHFHMNHHYNCHHHYFGIIRGVETRKLRGSRHFCDSGAGSCYWHCLWYLHQSGI